MTRFRESARSDPRSVAFGALAIFLPLFSVLIWWSFTHRVGDGFDRPGWYALPPGFAIAYSALVSGTIAFLAAQLIANHRHLDRVVKPNSSRIAVAVVFALATPQGMLFGILPFPLGLYWIITVLTFGTAGIVTGLEFLQLTGLLLVIALGWFLVIGLVRTGVRSRLLHRVIWLLCYVAVCATTVLSQGVGMIG